MDYDTTTTVAVAIGIIVLFFVLRAIFRAVARGGEKEAETGQIQKQCTGCGWEGTVSRYHKKCPNCGSDLY